MQRIPLRAVPNQSLQIVLGGQNCTLRLYTREAAEAEHLFCDLAVARELIISGIICQDMTPLVPYRHLAFEGQLFFVDMQGDEAPNWRGLNERWRLVRLEPGKAFDDADDGEGAA